MTEHTPGPWNLQYQSAPGGIDMYWLVEGVVSLGSNNPADAHLASAAPEMLDALDELEKAASDEVLKWASRKPVAHLDAAIYKARLAISKARGQTGARND